MPLDCSARIALKNDAILIVFPFIGFYEIFFKSTIFFFYLACLQCIIAPRISRAGDLDIIILHIPLKPLTARGDFDLPRGMRGQKKRFT